MPMISPAAVVIIASLMPPERFSGLPRPWTEIDAKTRIMPVTVPSSPSSGATPATASRMFRWRLMRTAS